MLPLIKGEELTVQFSAYHSTHSFNWYDTLWKQVTSLIRSYLSNNQFKERAWRVNKSLSHTGYASWHTFLILPNLSKEGKIKEKTRSNSQDKAATAQTEHSNATPCAGQPDGSGQYGRTTGDFHLAEGASLPKATPAHSQFWPQTSGGKS